MQKNTKVDNYINSSDAWQEELKALRGILLDCTLTEAFKWRGPCYTIQDRNIAMIGRLNESCTLSFFKGALLKDPEGILTLPGPNTRAARVIRFTRAQDIRTQEAILKAYIREAMEIENAGLKVDVEQDDKLPVPEELHEAFTEHPALKTAFNALTPGRQRAYLLHFSAGKQSATRAARIEKYRPRILIGKGINDCTCGHTKKPPGCDGSHKLFPGDRL